MLVYFILALFYVCGKNLILWVQLTETNNIFFFSGTALITCPALNTYLFLPFYFRGFKFLLYLHVSTTMLVNFIGQYHITHSIG